MTSDESNITVGFFLEIRFVLTDRLTNVQSSLFLSIYILMDFVNSTHNEVWTLITL